MTIEQSSHLGDQAQDAVEKRKEAHSPVENSVWDREWELLSSLPQTISKGFSERLDEVCKNPTSVLPEVVGGAAVAGALLYATKNPALVCQALQATRILAPLAETPEAAAAAMKWLIPTSGTLLTGVDIFGNRIGQPMLDTWCNPSHLYYDKKWLGKNVGSIAIDYPLLSAVGFGTAATIELGPSAISGLRNFESPKELVPSRSSLHLQALQGPKLGESPDVSSKPVGAVKWGRSEPAPPKPDPIVNEQYTKALTAVNEIHFEDGTYKHSIPNTREFIEVGGDAYEWQYANGGAKNGRSNHNIDKSIQTFVKVREILSHENGMARLGPVQNALLQHYGPGYNLNEALAKAADLIFCCYPELLPAWARIKHVFPESTGPLLMPERMGDSISSPNGRLFYLETIPDSEYQRLIVNDPLRQQ